MKKRKIIATMIFALFITVTLASAKTINLNKKTNENNSDLEILDINYEERKIITSIYANVSFRTVHVYFYKAKIIGDCVLIPVLHGVVHIRNEEKKINNASIPFHRNGSYQITVEIPGYDKLSKEIHIPKSDEKNDIHQSKNVDLSCMCGECYSFGIFGKEFRFLFFVVFNYGNKMATAPFNTDIYINGEKVTTKTHYLSIPPNKYGWISSVIFSNHGSNNDITIHVDGTDKFDEVDEKDNWDSYGGRG